MQKSSRFLVKKLSRNDCGWADSRENGHQSGPYIPHDIRKAGFFPELQNTNPDKPHIYDVQFETYWPSVDERKLSVFKHYSNKGSEAHMTHVPKSEFAGLAPASWLVGGTLQVPIDGSCRYWFMVIDSESEEAETLETVLELSSEFHYGIFDPTQLPSLQKTAVEQLIEELSTAVKSGHLSAFLTTVVTLPDPRKIALDAQNVFLEQSGLKALDPYEIQNPGDAVMRISRDIEFNLYKRLELRRRAAEIVRLLASGGSDLVTSIVRNFPAMDAIFLSASQQRKTRAGLSFELHVAALLRGGNIRYEAQAVTGGRRPDFVLPSVAVLKQKRRPFDAAMVLALKTTLRERWKQISMEKLNCSLFLATVDDRISEPAIEEMSKQGICLVVPESLKESDENVYADKTNVISFRSFFDDEIARKRPSLRIVHILPVI